MPGGVLVDRLQALCDLLPPAGRVERELHVQLVRRLDRAVGDDDDVRFGALLLDGGLFAEERHLVDRVGGGAGGDGHPAGDLGRRCAPDGVGDLRAHRVARDGADAELFDDEGHAKRPLCQYQSLVHVPLHPLQRRILAVQFLGDFRQVLFHLLLDSAGVAQAAQGVGAESPFNRRLGRRQVADVRNVAGRNVAGHPRPAGGFVAGLTGFGHRVVEFLCAAATSFCAASTRPCRSRSARSLSLPNSSSVPFRPFSISSVCALVAASISASLRDWPARPRAKSSVSAFCVSSTLTPESLAKIGANQLARVSVKPLSLKAFHFFSIQPSISAQSVSTLATALVKMIARPIDRVVPEPLESIPESFEEREPLLPFEFQHRPEHLGGQSDVACGQGVANAAEGLLGIVGQPKECLLEPIDHG